MLSDTHPAATAPDVTPRRSSTRTTARSVDVAEKDAGGTPAHAVPATAVYGPAFSNEGTAVFFSEGDAGGAHSALVRADGAPRRPMLKITRVLDGSSRNFHAQPSPDGTRIAFDSDREGTRGVFVADEQGRNVRRVSGDGFAAVPSWSPDGTRLAFVKAEADRPDVWNFWIRIWPPATSGR